LIFISPNIIKEVRELAILDCSPNYSVNKRLIISLNYYL
jgi:hypothetical protein